MDRRVDGGGLVGHINLKSLLHNSSKKSRGFWVNLPQMNFISWLKVKRVIKFRRIPVERWRWRTVRGALPPPKAGGGGRRIRWRFPPAAATGIKDGEGKDGTATLTDFSALRERSATPADLPADWFQRVAEDGAEEWDSKHYVRRARCHHTPWLVHFQIQAANQGARSALGGFQSDVSWNNILGLDWIRPDSGGDEV